jgi:hypothetical protein
VHQKSNLALLAFLIAFSFGVMTARATTFLQFQSTYLGDGWFQYQMDVVDDPFFTSVGVDLTLDFTNEIDHSTASTNWINASWNTNSSYWAFTNGTPARPFHETFLMRSSETAYKLATNFDSAILGMSLSLADFYPFPTEGVYSQNIVGYAWMSCLMPCPPEEANYAPTNYSFALKLVPDVAINQLVQTNGNIYGIDFIWDNASTFLLQGSADLNNWTNIAYVWSYPPETTWTTNTPLNSFGNFFRVSLIGEGYGTNLPPLSSAAAKAVAKNGFIPKGGPAGAPSVMGCSFSDGKVLVNVTSQPGQTIQIQAVDSHFSVKQSRQVVSKGPVTTSTFDAVTLPNPVYFQATLVP